MNCDRCGIEYQDDIPHPPAACATYASDELKKARTALDGALEKISMLVKEREAVFTPREINLAIDSVSRNFKRLQDLVLQDGSKSAPRALEPVKKDMEDLRQLHMRLLKWNRNTPKKSS